MMESLPFVHEDALDDFAFKKVARFLNMLGLLAEFLGINSNKDRELQGREVWFS